MQSDGSQNIPVDELELYVRGRMEAGAPLEETQMTALRQEIESQAWLDDLMGVMKAAGNDTRARILYLLWRRGEVRVNDLATILDLTTPAISQQLKKLRRSALVHTRRDAQTIYYRLNGDNAFLHSLGQFFQEGVTTLPFGSR